MERDFHYEMGSNKRKLQHKIFFFLDLNFIDLGGYIFLGFTEILISISI